MRALLFLSLTLLSVWRSESFTLPNSLKNSLKPFDDASTIATVDRRHALLGIVSGAIATTTSLTLPAFAASEDLSLYQDSTTGFQIKYPSSWKKSEQTLPDRRRLTLFLNDDESGKDKDLMFIAYTSVRDDFTSLGSFGSVDQVGSQTILPKGELMGEKTESVMLGSESKKNSYYFDYVSQVPNQPKRHFRTIFSLVQGATGGAGSVLVTITIQTTEDRYDMQKAMFDEVIDSFGKIQS